MKKFISLLKAMLSQDMNFFKYKVKSNSSKIKRLLLPIMIGIIVMFAIGSYAYMFLEPLSKVGLTYIVLSIFMIILTVVTFFEGIYKSQGILFECRDNNLLFSLPIEKSKIFSLRIIKLMLFQYIFTLLFMIPTYIVYIYFENPDINFYWISILMILLLPIIPTIISVVLGYIIKGISVKFKAKKIIQTILTFALVIGIFFLSYNMNNLINDIIQNASSINEIITKIYYPVGAYINLIQEFNFVELIKLLAINIIPLIAVIYIGSIGYFKIISKSINSSNSRVRNKEKIIVRTQITSLIKKELSKFFSSTVYMVNTSMGLVIILIATILLKINNPEQIQGIIDNIGVNVSIESIFNFLPIIYLQLIIFTGCTTSITSSSISIEGKSFNITKSLPIKEEKILFSKVIASDIISVPIMLISDIIFFIKVNVSIMDIIIILAFTVIMPTITAMIGLIVNLKYPKMNASSDTEVIKQSASSMISVLIGIIIFVFCTYIAVVNLSNIQNVVLIELIVFLVLLLILWKILIIYGKKRIRQINI